MASSRNGFTLVEVMVALSILLISLLGLVISLTTTIQANSQARHITAATNLAQDKLEEIRNTAYSSVTTGSDASTLTEAGGTSGSEAIYTRSWAVTDNSPVASTKTVTVTVTWTDLLASQTITLQTIVADQ